MLSTGRIGWSGLFMNTYSGVRSSRPAGLFSFGFLDGPQVRLRRPRLREAPAGFGFERLATIFMNNPGRGHKILDTLRDFRVAYARFARPALEGDCSFGEWTVRASYPIGSYLGGRSLVGG